MFLLTLIVLYVLIAEIYGNFHELDDGIYRSARLNVVNMDYYNDKYKFKTIINLQGKTSASWYKNELKVAKEHNITHINFKMRSAKFEDYNRSKELIEVIKNAQKPILIHCLGGADRTSLAAALYIYDKTKDEQRARKEMSWYYGHLPSIRPHVIAMDKSFDNYVKKEKEKNDK